jgi:BRCT domain type II-containing protein
MSKIVNVLLYNQDVFNMMFAGNRAETCSTVQTENSVIKLESCRTNCIFC